MDAVSVGELVWLDEPGGFVAVRAVAVKPGSVRVVLADPRGGQLADAVERGVRKRRLFTEVGMHRAVAVRELLAPSERVDTDAGGRHPDVFFAQDVLMALRDREYDGIYFLTVGAESRWVLFADLAAHAANLAGWQPDPRTWHEAVRIVPAELVGDPDEYADTTEAPITEDAIVAPATVLVALARDLVRSDPGLLDVVADREEAAARERRGRGKAWRRSPQLRSWRADLPANGPAAAAAGPAAEIDVALSLLRASGFAELPTVRAVLTRLHLARAALDPTAGTQAGGAVPFAAPSADTNRRRP